MKKRIALGVLGILGKWVLEYLATLNDIEIVGVMSSVDREGQYNCYVDLVKLDLPICSYDEIVKLKPDIYINISYPKIIGSELLNSCLAVNLHSAKLPDYRGRNVYTHIIQNNDLTAATTLHLMTENVDKGDIIAERQLLTSVTETAKELYDRLQILSFNMFKDVLPTLLTNSFSTRKQVSDGRYYTKTLNKELNLSEDPFVIYNKIRSLDFPPYEPAYYLEPDGSKHYVTLSDITYDFVTNKLSFNA